jgi:DNA-binding MarR family transcriptional regulator
MKEEFLNFLNELMKNAPQVVEELMTDNIRAYIDVLKGDKSEKPALTENGKTVLKYLREHLDTKMWKAKDLAEQMGISSRGASGTLRKLVNDGFCEKLGQDPVIYSLTEKGKTYVIIEGENE